MTARRPDEDESRPPEDRPPTKRELARESTGDEVGGEEHGRGAPTEHPEQFEEFADSGLETASDEEKGKGRRRH